MRTVNRHTLLGNVGNIIPLKSVLKLNVPTIASGRPTEKGKAPRTGKITVLDKKQANGFKETLARAISSTSSRAYRTAATRGMASRSMQPTSSRSSST